MAERPANPLVDQFRKGGVPRDLRLMAAQGALPLKPADLVDLLHHLLSDSDEPVRQAAGGTLGGFPVDEMLPIVKDKDSPPAVLAWAVAHREERELREVVLQNPSLPDEAVEALAATLPEHLAELVVINQVRLLRRNSLLEALETNPNLSNDQRRRLRELRETFHIGEQAAPPPAPPAPPPAEAPPAPPAAAPVEEARPPATEAEAMEHYLAEEERGDEHKVSVVQAIYRKTTSEKIITALKGSREERSILIRDPNRLVSTAVLGSPRLTPAEVEAFSAMKNVSEEILRTIGSNRDWTKSYPVISNLVRNPRTPLALSMGMVSRLNPRDMKTVSMDRNVPEPIRKQALKFVRQVGERDGGGKH